MFGPPSRRGGGPWARVGSGLRGRGLPHWRAGRVRVGAGLVFGAVGIGGSFVGNQLNKSVDPNVLLLAFAGLMLVAEYHGYGSCPLATGCCWPSSTTTPSIPIIDTQKERYDMWLLKRYGLPFIYWNLTLRGLARPYGGIDHIPNGV